MLGSQKAGRLAGDRSQELEENGGVARAHELSSPGGCRRLSRFEGTDVVERSHFGEEVNFPQSTCGEEGVCKSKLPFIRDSYVEKKECTSRCYCDGQAKHELDVSANKKTGRHLV